MRFRAVQFLLAILCALARQGWGEPSGRAASPSSLATEAKVLFGGGLSLGGVTFSPSAFSSSWAGYGAMGAGEPQPVSRGSVSSEAVAISAAFNLHTGPSGAAVLSGTGTFSETQDGGVRAEWLVTADRDGRFNEAFVGANLPTSLIGGGMAIVDGTEVPIPAQRGPKGHLFRAPASSLEVRGPDGAALFRAAFDEPTPILLQDNRHWNGDGLGIRLYFATNSCGAGREYAVKAAFHFGGSGSEPSSLIAAGTVRIAAGPEWIPLAQEPWIEPGSALDFSAAIPRHAPAGAFGRVVVRGGHFEFENLPGVPQRFYGVNVCGDANVPETAEEADRFAANLARIGYNAVRIHHHERHLVGEDGTTPDPERMARFDLLVAACVEHGLYLTTDLFVSRSHALPWRAIGIDRDGTVPTEKFKILCAFHEPAFSNLCAWARAFLTHVNPHTGRSLAEEPALATLALVNEGNLGNWGATALRDLPCVEEAWQAWLAAGGAGGTPRSLPPIPDSLYTQPFATFLADAETRLYERLRDFVRDELRCPAPLSSLSAWFEPEQYALPRASFDYIDTHFYVDHPKFLDKPWRLPSRCDNLNPMLGANLGAQDCVWLRQMGKPFTVSEFNFCGPGRYRGVGGIATGALAALQDWDGLWRFDWSYNREGMVGRGGPMGFFDIASDPLSLAAERAALCLFLRGDLAPLDAEAPLVLDPAALRDPAHGARFLPSLGDNAKAWKVRVGTRLDAPGQGPAHSTPTPKRVVEAALSASSDPVTGTLLIDTPRTCGGFAEGGAHTAGPLRFEIFGGANSRRVAECAERDFDLPIVDNDEQLEFVDNYKHSSTFQPFNLSTDDGGDAVAATVWASSLDGEPLATSRRILVTHLTDVQNTGIEYADPDRTTLLKWGRLPHLMRNGSAEISLTLEAAPALFASGGGATRRFPRIFRLSPSGRRLGEVPFNLAVSGEAQDILSFAARTDYDPAAATYLYEIVRE